MPRKSLLAVLLILTGCRPDGISKADFARARVQVLTLICQHYKSQNGDWPLSLDALALPQPKGGNPFVVASDLTDEWSHPYQYDAAGPKNGGEKPDIWTETPQGKVLGNWPGGR
jgi:hypothetical protein